MNHHHQRQRQQHQQQQQLLMHHWHYPLRRPTYTHSPFNGISFQNKTNTLEWLSSKLIQKRFMERYLIRDNDRISPPPRTSSLYRYTNQSGCRYKACTFLGEHDIIAAIDDNDCLDVVQFNRRSHNSSNGIGSGSGSDSDRTIPTSPFSTLCTNFSIKGGSSPNTIPNSNNINTTNDNNPRDQCSKIQSINNGSQIVIGMESGIVKVLSVDCLGSTIHNDLTKRRRERQQHHHFSHHHQEQQRNSISTSSNSPWTDHTTDYYNCDFHENNNKIHSSMEDVRYENTTSTIHHESTTASSSGDDASVPIRHEYQTYYVPYRRYERNKDYPLSDQIIQHQMTVPASISASSPKTTIMSTLSPPPSSSSSQTEIASTTTRVRRRREINQGYEIGDNVDPWYNENNNYYYGSSHESCYATTKRHCNNSTSYYNPITSDLIEIFNSDNTKYNKRSNKNDSYWDFCCFCCGSSNSQVQKQLLLSAHISRYADSFYLQTIDIRQQQKQKQKQQQHCCSRNHAVCIDIDMKGNMDFTGLCFLSDHLLATSTTTNATANAGGTSSIKIWDIRFINSNPTRDDMGYVSNIQLCREHVENEYESVLPAVTAVSYPNDPVYGMQSSTSFSLNSTSKRRKWMVEVVPWNNNNNNNNNNSCSGDRNCSTIIHNIASFDCNGNMLVTLDSPRGEEPTGSSSCCYYAVIDPVRMCVLSQFGNTATTSSSCSNNHTDTAMTTPCITQQRQHSQCNLPASYPITAVNKMSGCVAAYNENIPNSITFRYPQCRPGGGGGGKNDDNNYNSNRRRKRETGCSVEHSTTNSDTTSTTSSSSISSDNNNRNSNSFLLNVPIKDRYMLQTQLSYLAFNESGSQLAGVSVDGDIYVW